MTAIQPFFPFKTWMEVRDGDDAARAVFDRHYSRYVYADGRQPKLFVGPGEKTVLVTPCRRALFVWRNFISADGQLGINCAIFRNEGGAGRSSDLILVAEDAARERWGDARLFTYVNPRKVQSGLPGWCFIQAGWSLVGVTKKRKYLIFAKYSVGPVNSLHRRVKHVRLTLRATQRGRSK